MKTKKCVIKKMFFIFIALITTVNIANAQHSTNDKDSSQAVSTKNMIDAQHFVFIAESVSPLRGTVRYITTDYDVKVSPDTVTAYLPYFGRAYSAPINPNDNGINFTSTKFDYKVTPGKKSTWNILIKPRNDASVQELSLHVFSNSSATLNVVSQNRDPISYRGYVMQGKQKK